MISIDLRFIYYLDAKVQLFGDKRLFTSYHNMFKISENNNKNRSSNTALSGITRPIFLSIKNLYSYFSLHQQTHSEYMRCCHQSNGYIPGTLEDR